MNHDPNTEKVPLRQITFVARKLESAIPTFSELFRAMRAYAHAIKRSRAVKDTDFIEGFRIYRLHAMALFLRMVRYPNTPRTCHFRLTDTRGTAEWLVEYGHEGADHPVYIFFYRHPIAGLMWKFTSKQKAEHMRRDPTWSHINNPDLWPQAHDIVSAINTAQP